MIQRHTFRLKGEKVLAPLSITPSHPSPIPLTPRKESKDAQCTHLLISSIGTSSAVSWKPHIHKANKASFFNDSSEYIFAAASLDLLVIMVSSNVF